jgi:hypothetical protein
LLDGGVLVADFLDSLPFSDEERDILRARGVSTPIGLLSMRKASTPAFDSLFRPGRAEVIAGYLKQLLSDEELQRLNQPVSRGGALGARLGNLPKRRPPV